MMNTILSQQQRRGGDTMPIEGDNPEKKKTPEELAKEREEQEIFEEAYARATEEAIEDREWLRETFPDMREELENREMFHVKWLRKAYIRGTIDQIKSMRKNPEDFARLEEAMKKFDREGNRGKEDDGKGGGGQRGR